MLGKIEGRRRRGLQRMRRLDGITDSMHMSVSKLQEMKGQGSMARCSPWGHKMLDTSEWSNSTNNEIFGVMGRVGDREILSSVLNMWILRYTGDLQKGVASDNF